MELYDQLILYVDGLLLTDLTSLTYRVTADDQQVMTVVKGFAGLSPSPEVLQCEFELALSTAGVEYEFEKAKMNRTEVELRAEYRSGGEVFTSRGYIIEASRQSGVGQTTTVSVSFIGDANSFR